MRGSQWIEYVWVEGVGVLWNPPHGDPLRRAGFTRGTHFQTRHGELYIDSTGFGSPGPMAPQPWVGHRTQTT